MLKWILGVVAVFVCLGGVAFGLRWMKMGRRSRVDFEMAQYEGREMGQHVVSSNRRPMNNSTGYGEFVD